MSKKPFFKKRFSTDGWPSVDFLLNQLEGDALTSLRPALRVTTISRASSLLGYPVSFDKGPSTETFRTSARVAGRTLKAWVAGLQAEREALAPSAVSGWLQIKLRELEKAHQCWQDILIRAHASNLIHADIRASNLLLACGSGGVVLDWEPQVLIRAPQGFYRVLGNHPLYRQIRIQPRSEYFGGAVEEFPLIDRLKAADLQVLSDLVGQAQRKLRGLALAP